MLFDTNILIAYLNGEVRVWRSLQSLRKEGYPFFISSITRAELLSLSSLTRQQEKKIKEFLNQFISLSFDDAVADTAAILRRRYRLKLPDAAIAATA